MRTPPSNTPLSDQELQDLQRRQRRSARTLVIGASIVFVLLLILPLAIGIGTYGLLDHYETAPPMLRFWLSVSAGLLSLALLHVVVMIPMTTFIATQAKRMRDAFEGTAIEGQEAHELLDAIEDAHNARTSAHTTNDPPSSSDA